MLIVATHHSGLVRESLCYVRIWKLHRTLFGNALTLFFPGTHRKYQAHNTTHLVTDLLTAPWRYTRCAPVLHLHFACARIPMTSMCLGRILKVKHAVLAKRIYISRPSTVQLPQKKGRPTTLSTLKKSYVCHHRIVVKGSPHCSCVLLEMAASDRAKIHEAGLARRMFPELWRSIGLLVSDLISVS